MTDKEKQLEQLITLLEKFDEAAKSSATDEIKYLKAKMDLFRKMKEVVLS